jgi:hypothetical protein
LLTALFAGCGGDSSSSGETTASRSHVTQTTQTRPRRQSNRQAELEYRAVRAEVRAESLPRAEEPRAHPGVEVDRLVVRNIKQGSGRAVRPGDGIWADFIEANYTNGRRFYWAWVRIGPDLRLTTDSWMRGLILGMTGMRPGVVYWDVVLRSIGEHERYF